MGWRTVVVNKNCKLSYKNDHLIVRSEDIEMIHLSEINTIIVENGMVSITSYLLNELINHRIKLVLCDEKHNPAGEVMPYYGAHNTSKKVLLQSKWKNYRKGEAWRQIIKNKIYNQAEVLKRANINGYEKLLQYIDEVEVHDKTNREGHAAKVYFNLLFGKDFSRDDDNEINKALNYGYAILLSTFNREIVNKGYITQIGIQHKNEFNQFNLSCDLMEQFRPLVDEIVYKSISDTFDKNYKYKLINVLNQTITINKKEQYLCNAVPIFITSVFNFLENNRESEKIIFNYEF